MYYIFCKFSFLKNILDYFDRKNYLRNNCLSVKDLFVYNVYFNLKNLCLRN